MTICQKQKRTVTKRPVSIGNRGKEGDKMKTVKKTWSLVQCSFVIKLIFFLAFGDTMPLEWNIILQTRRCVKEEIFCITNNPSSNKEYRHNTSTVTEKTTANGVLFKEQSRGPQTVLINWKEPGYTRSTQSLLSSPLVLIVPWWWQELAVVHNGGEMC